MVDITPGDSGANKGFWRRQLRDRYGRFVKMGGSVMFDVDLPGVQGKATATGTFIGMLDLQTARIDVPDSSKIPKGVYLVKTKDITSIEAVLPADYVEKKTAEAIADTTPLLKTISGTDALKTRLRSVANALKAEGRFPLPRQASLIEIDNGDATDTSKGAKIDYKKVFDQEPSLQDRYETFEAMWEYVRKNGTDLTTQSPNDLNEIPEEMKELNRAYAKHVLGLEPDGLITVYRNAVNGKDTEAESAVGYVSLDRQMAWDYNSTRENIGANGRYEIDVKPDEVYGMLGYSRVEDEYGLTIGRGVTSQSGRVRRIGDLEPARLPDWLQDWNETFQRGRGQSPLRFFGLASEYDFHEVEDFGKNLDDFISKYNLQTSDIADTFDRFYGEGAYAEYKASGNTVSFQLIRKMFTELENGKLGLNLPYLEQFQTLKPNAEYKNDQFDNIMKMLSVFQELTGEHFMTHKTRDYDPPAAPDLQEAAPEPTEPAVDKYETVDFNDVPKITPRGVSQTLALDYYTEAGDNGYHKINTYLRTGEWYPGVETEDDRELVLEKIEVLKDLVNSVVIPKDVKIFRYQRQLPTELSQVGSVWTSKGFLSTSAKTVGGEEAVTAFTNLPFILEIDVPEGSRGGALLDSSEAEIILPPGSRFLVESVEDIGLKQRKVKLLLVGQDDQSTSESPSVIPPGFENWHQEVEALLEAAELVDPDRGNGVQSVFLEAAGYNGNPQTLTQKEFDAIESETIYRAVTNKAFIEDYKNSAVQYAGEGSFGNGTYATNKVESTVFYAGDTSGDTEVINSRTMEMKLATDANILFFEDVAELREWANNKAKEFLEGYEAAGANPAQYQEVEWKLFNDSDWTNFAIMSGIDAIRFKVPMTQNDEYYTIILNRGKVIINGKS